MENTQAFPSGFPLQGLPEVTTEVFFAFHFGIRKMVFLNEAFEKVWDISRSDATADASLLIHSVHPDDREVVAASFTAVQKGEKQDLEFRIQLRDETVKWIKLNAYLSSKGDNNIIIGTATDVTGLKSYSDTLHKFNTKKNSILQLLSHDLLGPLGNIKMSISLLSSYNEISYNTEMVELVNVMSQSCQRSVTMIQDLINNEFLQSSEVDIVKERVDIVKKIGETVAQFRQSPRDGQQRFFLKRLWTACLYPLMCRS